MKKIYHCDGEVIFHDPGPEMLPYFRGIDPSFTVQSMQPVPGFIPKLNINIEYMKDTCAVFRFESSADTRN